MDSFASRLLFLTLTILIVLVPVGVHSQENVAKLEANETLGPRTVHRHQRRLHKTPEDAIRRQIERVKEKILSQLSYSVRTAPPAGSARSPLPQPLLHMYDIDMTGQRTVSAIADIDHPGRSEHRSQTTHDMEYDSKYKQAKLIIFGHESKYIMSLISALALNDLEYLGNSRSVIKKL